MAASNFKRSTSSVSTSFSNKVKRIRRRKGLIALSAAASAVTLFGVGRYAKADTKTFEYNYSAQFGPNTPNNLGGGWSGDLSNTFWFDLTNSNATASHPTAADIAQFDITFANMNPSDAGGPPLGANVGLTLGLGQTSYGGLNVLAPAGTSTWINGSGATLAFVMSINGADTTSFLQIGSGGINVQGSGTFQATDTQITVPITLTAVQSWNVTNIPLSIATAVVSGTTVASVTNSTGLLVNGGISLGSKGANALTINGNAGTSGSIVTLSGAIVDGGPTPSGITANNVTLTLSASNSFTGGLNVGGGSLVETGSGNGFGGNGNNINMTGGTIEVTGSGGGVRNFNNYSVNGSGASVDGLGDDVTWTNVPLNINVNSTANTFTINQHLAGNTFINQSGGGAIVLGQATNSYTGGTTIGAGSTLTATDLAALGTGLFSNSGTFNVLTSVNLSGGQGGNGGTVQIGGGFGSTMTVTNVNGPLNNVAVGNFNNATLVLDFSHSDTSQPLVTGGVNGAQLNMGGGNLLIIANPTAAAVQVFTTTSFTGASAAAPGQIHTITATGAAGQVTVFLGSYDFNAATGGFSTIEKSNTQYGNEVIFNGPLANVGTANPISDFGVANNPETFAAPLLSSQSSGSNTPTTSLGSNYYSGFALYGNSDFAAVTSAVNGTSYIVPGSAISGFYLEASVSAGVNTTSAIYTSDGITTYTFGRQPTTDVASQVWDVDSAGPFFNNTGNLAYNAIRFNNPTGGFSTAGGNSMLQLLTTSLVESGNILVTANVGASDIIMADQGKVAAGASSLGTQDTNLGRNANGDFTFWNMDYQGNTAGIFIDAEGMSDAKSGGAGVSHLGPGMFAEVATSGYTGPTTVQGGVLETSSNAGLGGSGTNQALIELNAGTLVTINSMALDNRLYNSGTPLARGIIVGPLGAQIAASNSTSLIVDGTMTGSGNLVIGMGSFMAVTQTAASSTLGLALSTGGGSVILSGTHTGFTGNIIIDNSALGGPFNAALQMDGSYSATTTVTVPDGNNQSLLSGSPTTTIANIYVGQGQIFYPGDVGNGTFSVANIVFGNTSALQFAMNPATTSTTDVLSVTQMNGFNTAGTEFFSFFQAGTSQNFNTTGTYDLINIFGSTNAFGPLGINGVLAVNSVSTQVGPFSLVGSAVTPLTTYALQTVAVGNNETELELIINSNVIAATWINPVGSTFDTGANWVTNNGLHIAPNGLVDTAIFSSNAATPITVTGAAGGDTMGNIVFNSTNSYTLSVAAGIEINNGTNVLPASGVVLDLLGGHTIASTVSAPGGVSVVVTNATDAVTMSGNIQNGLTGAPTINSAGLQINGVNLQGNPIQQGNGTVILTNAANSGTETYTGGTNIFGGTLQLGNGTISAIIPTQGATPMLLDGNLAFNENSTVAAGTTYTFVNTVNVASGSGTFTELAPNTMVVLSPAAAYLPASNPVNLTINAGAFRQGNASAETWGIVTMSAGSIFDLNSLASTVGSLGGAGTVVTAGGNTSFGFGGNSANTTWAGTIKNTGGTLALNKTGNGNFVFAVNSTNAFNGGLTENGGSIRFTTSTNIPNGPLNGITIGIVVAQANGPLVLSNGVTLANPILDQQASGDLVELPDVNETAYMSGAITFASSNQMRLGYVTPGNKLYVSGTEVNTGSNLGFFIGGNIDLLNGYSLTTQNTGFGRNGTNQLDLRMFGNAAITLAAATDSAMGFNGNGGNMPVVTIELNGTSSMNLLTGQLDMDNSGASSVLNTLVLNGGSLAAGQVIFTPPSAAAAAQATAVIDFNGGILIANASHTNFVPAGTAGHFFMNVGSLGVKLSTNGFNEIITSDIGFISGNSNAINTPPNSDTQFTGQDGGIKKLGAGNLSFTSSFGDDNLGAPVNGRVEVSGGSLDYAGEAAAQNLLGNAAFVQVDAGGAIGADDGSLTDTTLITKMTTQTYVVINSTTTLFSAASQSGGLLLSTNDLSTNIDYTGLQFGAFNMTNPGDSVGVTSTVSFANMSIGAVADPSALGTTGVALVYTGTITPANFGPLANTYQLGGGGTLALANADAITGINKLLVENSGVVWLQSTNTYTGGTTILGAQVTTNDLTGASQLETTTLLVNFLGDADANSSSLGLSNPNNPANLLINGGTLEYIGNGDTSNLLFTLGALGGHIDSSGSGALILQNTGSEAFGAGIAGTFAFILSGSEGTIGTIQSIAGGTASSVNKLYASVSAPAGATISFVKQGAGAWELKGSNSFAGGMSIQGGEVQMGSPNALWLNQGGSFAQVTVNSLLDLNGNNLTVGLVTGSTGGIIDNVLNAIDPVLTINTGNFGTLTLGNSATYSGSILNSNGTALTSVVITGNGNQIFSGNSNFYGGGTTISTNGNGTLTTLTLAGSNGTLGATPVGTGNVLDNGLLQLGRSDALVTIANNISGSGIVNTTNGTYLLTGALTWTGGTTIGNTATGSMIRLNSANQLPTIGGITINQALDLNGFNGQFNIPVLASTAKGEITNTNGSVTVTITNTATPGTVGLSFQNGINNTAGNNNTGALAVIFTGGGVVNLTSTGSNNIGNTVVDTGLTLFLTGNGGTPLGAAGVSGAGGGNVVYDQGTIVDQPSTSSAAATNIGNNILGTGSFIVGSSNVGLSNNANVVTMTGTNTYSGGTTLNNTLSQIVINSFTTPLGTGGVVDNGIINLNSIGLTVTGSGLSGTVAGAQVLQNQVLNTATFVNTSASTTTFAGQFINSGKLIFGVGATATTVMSGALALTQNGPGTLVLTGANTYVGPTAITGGTLEIGNGGATGSIGTGTVAGVILTSPGAVSISGGAALVYNLSSSPTVANNISGGGSFSQIGSGTTTLTGSNLYGGGTNIGVGSSLIIGSQLGLPAASTVVNNGHLLVKAGTKANSVISGHIGGTGDITVGIGATTGYLKLAANTHTSSASAVVVNAGSTLDISNNVLQVNYGANADPVATIAGEIGTAYAAGNWTGTSATSGVITSSTAATGGPVPLAVGYADGNSDAGTLATANQVVIKYTISGDSNLNGSVDFNDLVAVVQNFNKAGDWAHGNFQFTSTINFNDLVAVVQNFNKSANPAGSSGSSLGGGGSVGLSASVQVQNTAVQVPEPASFTLLGAGAAGLLARRRRKTAK